MQTKLEAPSGASSSRLGLEARRWANAHLPECVCGISTATSVLKCVIANGESWASLPQVPSRLMDAHPLDQPASVALVQEWRQKELIGPAAHEALIAQLRPVRLWREWGALCFLVLGTALVLAGIIFFFAWNWNGMTRWQRLIVPVIGVLLPALGSRLLAEGGLPRRMALLAASVMIGVFLAVFGQEYQTGADAYELFLGWSLLAMPWVLAAEFPALWAVWLVIASTALATWWDQEGKALEGFAGSWQACVLAITGLHALALAARELLAGRLEWLRERWLRLWLLLVAILPPCAVACVWIVLEFKENHMAPVAAAWLAAASAAFALYRWRLKDSAAMAVAASSAGAVIVSAAARGLWEMLDGMKDSGAVFFGFIFFCGAIGTLMGGIVWALRKIAAQMAETPEPPPLPEATVAEPIRAALPRVPSWREALAAMPGDTESRQALERQIHDLASRTREPVWLKVVSTLGAWLAAWTFIPMLWWVLVLITQSESAVVHVAAGAVVLGTCAWVSLKAGESTFKQQMNLALALGAVGLINGAVATMQHAEGGIANVCLAQVVVALVTYPVFRSATYRFLISVFTALMITLWLVIRTGNIGGLMPVWIACVALAAALLWAWRARPAVLNPLAHACAFSLGGLVIFHAFVTQFRSHGVPNVSVAPAAWVLAAGVVFMICALNRGVASLGSPWVIGVAVIAVALAWFGEAGILTAVLLAVAGYAWGDKLLHVFAWLFLAGFLFFFYYSLRLPLSWKSFIIGGTGIALLLLRWLLAEMSRRDSAKPSVS